MKRFVLSAILVLLLAGASVAQAADKEICVKASRANLRAGPGTNYRITWEVNRYMPLVQVGQEGDWIKVRDVDGDIHWIYRPLITSKLNCITVRASKANIRKAPSTGSGKWFTVEKYTSFKQVGRKGSWVKIEYEGQVMWVYATLVWPG